MKKYLYATILILSASQAYSRAASPEVPLTKRELIEKVSPVALESLRRLEVRRGISFKNDELISVMQGAEYKREHAAVHHEFCAKKENATNLACVPQE